MEIKKVGVLGAGLMGHGIAQVAAQSGYDVVLREVDQDRLAKGLAKIEKQLGRAVEKGKMEQSEADAVRGRIQSTIDYADLADCDLVIEAITENLAEKLEMWKAVDGVVKDGALFATNTSSLPVIDQAAATSRPDRFVGLHYFNPAQVMKLVEVVRAVTTSDEAFDAGVEFTEEHRQARASRRRTRPASSSTACSMPYMLDAIRALRGGRGHDRRDRRGDEGRRRPPDGAAHARRLRGPRHDGGDLRRDVRRVPRAPVRAARRRFARCSPRAGTAARRAWASTTTRATSP